MTALLYRLILVEVFIAIPLFFGCVAFAVGLTATIWCPTLCAFIGIVVSCAGVMLY